jgi:hypothetical protein
VSCPEDEFNGLSLQVPSFQAQDRPVFLTLASTARKSGTGERLSLTNPCSVHDMSDVVLLQASEFFLTWQ